MRGLEKLEPRRNAWGGQFENYERASKRLAVVIPAVMAIIIGMLFWMFKSARPALAVFSVVPLAATRRRCSAFCCAVSPLVLPAAVGFIALGGVSVLDGVVISSTAKARMAEGEPAERAVAYGATHSVRAVLTTAAVAALGFLPMALSTSAGSEVQRPLATVVIVGIVFGTVLTLAVFSGSSGHGAEGVEGRRASLRGDFRGRADGALELEGGFDGLTLKLDPALLCVDIRRVGVEKLEDRRAALAVRKLAHGAETRHVERCGVAEAAPRGYAHRQDACSELDVAACAKFEGIGVVRVPRPRRRVHGPLCLGRDRGSEWAEKLLRHLRRHWCQKRRPEHRRSVCIRGSDWAKGSRRDASR